jgi:hypothetical protein
VLPYYLDEIRAFTDEVAPASAHTRGRQIGHPDHALVMLDDAELAEIQKAARRQRMTTEEWVRQTLRAARRVQPRGEAKKKLDVVRDILDYTGSATRLFADPTFDGDPVQLTEEELAEDGRTRVIHETPPPFGGEEEKGIQGNFPEDRQTSETALLFLQLIMRKLRRRPTPERLSRDLTTRFSGG